MRRLALLVLLAGCTLGPDWKTPDAPTPTGLANQGGVTAISSDEPWQRWWEVFRDPVLDKLVADARESNQRLKAAYAHIRVERALLIQARGPLLPTISLDGEYTYEKISRNTAGFPVGGGVKPFIPSDFFQGTADLSWELDLFGRIRRGLESSEDEAAASIEDRRAFEVSLVADVADAYFDLGEAEAAIALASEIVTTRERSLGLVKDRLAAGVAQELELRRAEGELESARAAVPDGERRRALAEHRLAVLLGKAPDVHFGGKPPATFALPPTIPVGLPATLLQRRPDVRATEARAASQNALAGQAIASFFPRMTLLGQFGYASLDAGKLAYFGSQLFSIGPSVHVPIFEGGVTYALLLEKEARRDEAVAVYRDTILTAFREVADAVSSLHAHEDVRDRQARAVAAADRALELAEVQYKEGLTSYVTVLDTQRSQIQAKDALLAAQRDVLRDIVSLEKALAGGWE